MYKILILAYLMGADPVMTQQNFEMQGWFKTMSECKANLLEGLEFDLKDILI